jgi:hypothetical protein
MHAARMVTLGSIVGSISENGLDNLSSKRGTSISACAAVRWLNKSRHFIFHPVQMFVDEDNHALTQTVHPGAVSPGNTLEPWNDQHVATYRDEDRPEEKDE